MTESTMVFHENISVLPCMDFGQGAEIYLWEYTEYSQKDGNRWKSRLKR
jgi:hypothetical protein